MNEYSEEVKEKSIRLEATAEQRLDKITRDLKNELAAQLGNLCENMVLLLLDLI